MPQAVCPSNAAPSHSGEKRGVFICLQCTKNRPREEPVSVGGRGERIRTSDLSVPNAALYQAEPRPVINGAGGGSRTHMKLPSMVFETIASAIPPLRLVMPGCASLTNRNIPDGRYVVKSSFCYGCTNTDIIPNVPTRFQGDGTHTWAHTQRSRIPSSAISPGSCTRCLQVFLLVLSACTKCVERRTATPPSCAHVQCV